MENVHPSFIRQMRLKLGMTLNKLGEACGVSTATIAQLEQREALGKISVETLRRAAEAMNCEFQYSFVPKSDLKTFLHKKAYVKASDILHAADLHMSLENQKVKTDIEERIQNLKKKLIKEGKVW